VAEFGLAWSLLLWLVSLVLLLSGDSCGAWEALTVGALTAQPAVMGSREVAAARQQRRLRHKFQQQHNKEQH
jgi:phage I-like protein